MAKNFPRPSGGPEPTPLGDGRAIPDGNAPTSPGYDYSGSLDGAGTGDLKRGYRDRSKITDASSDPANWIHPPGGEKL
jgi:hypothetical protein